MSKARRHLCRDPIMREIVEATRLRQRHHDGDVYLALLRSIVFQQLSGKAASTIFGRFIQLFPDEYPDATQLRRLHKTKLTSCGLSKQKADYVQNVARYWSENDLDETDWTCYSDEEFIAEVTPIKGVGVWTAQMVLMFTLKRPDVLPLNDLGIRNAIVKAYRLRSKGPRLETRMTEVARAWRPYRTLACRYLWEWVDST